MTIDQLVKLRDTLNAALDAAPAEESRP